MTNYIATYIVASLIELLPIVALLTFEVKLVILLLGHKKTSSNQSGIKCSILAGTDTLCLKRYSFIANTSFRGLSATHPTRGGMPLIITYPGFRFHA